MAMTASTDRVTPVRSRVHGGAYERAISKKPSLVVVDSIQTIGDPDVPSAPGSVVQVRECAHRLVGEAKRRGLDGVVCGHIHHAEMRLVQGVMYMNDGDWVESCTALVEHPDGRFELIDWASESRLSVWRTAADRRLAPA